MVISGDKSVSTAEHISVTGNRPYNPGKRPPVRTDQPCYKQPIPDLSGPASAQTAGGPGLDTAPAQKAPLK